MHHPRKGAQDGDLRARGGVGVGEVDVAGVVGVGPVAVQPHLGRDRVEARHVRPRHVVVGRAGGGAAQPVHPAVPRGERRRRERPRPRAPLLEDPPLPLRRPVRLPPPVRHSVAPQFRLEGAHPGQEDRVHLQQVAPHAAHLGAVRRPEHPPLPFLVTFSGRRVRHPGDPHGVRSRQRRVRAVDGDVQVRQQAETPRAVRAEPAAHLVRGRVAAERLERFDPAFAPGAGGVLGCGFGGDRGEGEGERGRVEAHRSCVWGFGCARR